MSNQRHMQQLLRRVNTPSIESAIFGGVYVVSQGQHYTPEDALAVAAWLAERATGYLELRKFEGGGNWPVDWPRRPDDRACHAGHCCRVARDRIEAANLEAYHGDIDGDGNY